MDYQWGNRNFLLIIDKNNIICCKTDQKKLKRLLKLTLIYSSYLNIQVSDDRNRFNYLTHAAEEGKQLPGGLKSEKHLAEVVKDYDREAAEMREPRNTSAESK